MTPSKTLFSSSAKPPCCSTLGSGTTLVFGNGAGSQPNLWYTGTSANSTNRTINLNGGTTRIISQDAKLTLAGNISPTGATPVLQLSGDGGGNFNEVSGVISGNIAVQVVSHQPVGGTAEAGAWILSGNNTYTGATTISAGTLEIGAAGLLGSGSYAGNIVNSGTTLNTGMVVIGHANAAGSGTITQTDATSLLKIDTTGTITNNMSVYNVLASQSATLSGAITVNNATWDIETGDSLTISGNVSGSGGVTKNGNGTLILSGNNTYTAPTVVNAGTLNAASANALGSNNTVQVNGGTLLVSADDAINGMNITLNGTSTTVATLSFTGNYSGAVGNLTLSANSIIDLGTGSTRLSLHDIEMGIYYLKFHNWTGNTLWDGGTGNDTDRVYIISGVTNSELGKMQFYSGTTNDSFLGTGFDLGLTATSFDPGLSGYQIIPVPEPETWATGILLVLGGGVWLWRKRRHFTTQTTEREGRASAPPDAEGHTRSAMI